MGEKMAMTKEQQKEASRRILEKEPLTEEERELLRFRTMTPEQYPRPGESRACGICGARFRDTLNQKGEIVTSMLEKFSDHQASHNPSPEQWKTAHERIQQGKEAAKSRT